MPQTRTLFYAILKPWVRFGARIFFRRIEVSGVEKMPRHTPLILVANHQNAMLDPVLACVFSPKQLHWLTRADVFRAPLPRFILSKMNMLPVYRERDRVDDITGKNRKVFDECYYRLSHEAVICVFPEGSHHGRKQMMQLKKGVTRLALDSLEKGLHDLSIIPLGFDYENYYQYRKDLLLKFGEPISLAGFADRLTEDRNRLQVELLQVIREGLEKVMIDIRSDDIYDELMAIRTLSDKVSGEYSLEGQFRYFQSLVRRTDADESFRNDLRTDADAYVSSMNELGLNEELYREKIPATDILLLLIAPLALPAAIIFYPIYALTEAIVRKVVKDPLFINSIRLCVWTFLATIFFIIILSVVSATTNLLTGAIVTACVFISGIIAVSWLPAWKRIMHFAKCRQLKNNGSTVFANWLQYRKKLSGEIAGIKKRVHGVVQAG